MSVMISQEGHIHISCLTIMFLMVSILESRMV